MTVQRPQRTSPKLPRAARLQPDLDRRDHELARIAQGYQPGVRWWWGHRKDAGQNIIQCYLCGLVLVRGTGIDRLSRRAADAVMLHREAALADFAPFPGNDAGAAVVPAAVPPSGGSK